MKEPTDDDVAAAKAAGHVDQVHQLTIEGTDAGFEDMHILVRMPTQPEFRRWQRETSDDNNRIVAQSNLVAACLLWPDSVTFRSMTAKRPGIEATFSGELITMAGLARSTQKKVR